MNLKVVIIGAGPAGIACAIQLARYGIKPVLLEKNSSGGLLRNANCVENYPGHMEGISGHELVKKFTKHMEKYEISPIFEEVVKVSLNNGIYDIKTQNSDYQADFLVVASGTKPKKLNIIAKNVFYEICELYKQDLTNKKIVIIGSGDAAFDYALNLTANSHASEITILNRSDKTSCLPLLKQRVLANPKIKYLENTIFNENTEYDYVLGAIGREPELGFLENTNTPGLLLIGDVKNGKFRQATIAAGDGIKAAMKIYAQVNN